MTATRSGNRRRQPLALLLAAALCVAAPASAALRAALDRYDIRMGETAQLTISSDGAVDPAAANLDALAADFEILQRSSSVSTEIINGRREQTRTLVLEITPRREGRVVIAPFEVDGERSEALAVDVRPELQLGAGDEIVLFEAEVDRSQVYVQGQVLLTLRIQQAVNLESRGITELQVDGAFVKSLGQSSFQRTANGRPWLVHEIRYALFPESSGELRIPPQTFSGRLASGRRSLFDTRSSGRLIRRTSEALTIQVKPRPASFTAPVWLPATALEVDEQWSDTGSEIRVGDSITRSVTVTGTGLQGAQLPPVRMQAPDGLRIYPDQPIINDVEGAAGLTGVRTDSLALVAVRPGDYALPPVTIRWWDTAADAPRETTLPGRRLRVLPAAAAADATATAATDAVSTAVTGATGDAPVAGGPWPWLAAICAAGWLVTSVLLWRRSRAPAPRPRPGTTSATAARNRLLAACAGNDPAQALRHLRQWLREQGHRAPPVGWAEAQGDPELLAAVEELEAALYAAGAPAQDWDGARLARALRGLPASSARREALPEALPPLYRAAS